MKCVFENCRHETDKYLVFDRTDENGAVSKEAVAVCDDCVRVYLTALNEKYRRYRILLTNILCYGLGAFILPALVFEIMRIPATVACPLLIVTCVPLIILFRRREIGSGNDLIDGELDKYRERAALSELADNTGAKYRLSE